MICTMDFDMFSAILIFYPKTGFCMGYSLCMMADFYYALISRIFSVFSSDFLHTATLNGFFNEFCQLFGILIFDPKKGFCMGYSLCMMADFQNSLTSRIFTLSLSGFLHRTTCNRFYNKFLQVFWSFNFSLKVMILHGL